MSANIINSRELSFEAGRASGPLARSRLERRKACMMATLIVQARSGGYRNDSSITAEKRCHSLSGPGTI